MIKVTSHNNNNNNNNDNKDKEKDNHDYYHCNDNIPRSYFPVATFLPLIKTPIITIYTFTITFRNV